MFPLAIPTRIIGLTLSAAVAIGAAFAGSSTIAAETRTWTDSTGAFSIEAELVSSANNQVQLRKADGRVITVPLDRLSANDRAYVRSAANPDIHDKLAAPAEFEFNNTPLDEVARFLQEQHETPFVVERWALEKAGLDANPSITARSGPGSLAENLTDLLEPFELAWSTEGDVVLISTPKAVKRCVHTCVYKPLRAVNLKTLAEEISTNIAPQHWQTVGGIGLIRPMRLRVLVVMQRPDAHQELRRHYAKLLLPIKPPPLDDESDATKKALAQSVTCDFTRTPLEDAVEQLGEQHGVHIGIHKASLRDAGIAPDAPITCKLSGVPLRTVLSVMLREVDLAWAITRTGLLIAPAKQVRSEVELVSYEVDDLCDDKEDYDELGEVIRRTMWASDLNAWADTGGRGTTEASVRGTLDVRNTYRIHHKIERLLAALRAAKLAG